MKSQFFLKDKNGTKLGVGDFARLLKNPAFSTRDRSGEIGMMVFEKGCFLFREIVEPGSIAVTWYESGENLEKVKITKLT